MTSEREKLLTDMRCQVEYTHVATMPIPLYERMKAALNRPPKEAMPQAYAEAQAIVAEGWPEDATPEPAKVES